MKIRTAPCDWPLLGDCPDLDDLIIPAEGEGEPDTSIRDAVVAMATAHLWNWTGRTFGVCEVSVRPCREDCVSENTYLSAANMGGPFRPVLVGGVWRNITCWTCDTLCSCTNIRGLRLPGPIESVTSVHIDGEEVDKAAYRVDDFRILVRVDGKDWPACQDLNKPPDDGGFVIVYKVGVPVPEGGQLAAGLLACQMAKGLIGDKSCQLPVRVQTITREGVTVGVLDAFEGLEAGKTGVWLVDSWVASVTQKLARSKVVYPPARQSYHRTTYQGAGDA